MRGFNTKYRDSKCASRVANEELDNKHMMISSFEKSVKSQKHPDKQQLWTAANKTAAETPPPYENTQYKRYAISQCVCRSPKKGAPELVCGKCLFLKLAFHKTICHLMLDHFLPVRINFAIPEVSADLPPFRLVNGSVWLVSMSNTFSIVFTASNNTANRVWILQNAYSSLSSMGILLSFRSVLHVYFRLLHDSG